MCEQKKNIVTNSARWGAIDSPGTVWEQRERRNADGLHDDGKHDMCNLETSLLLSETWLVRKHGAETASYTPSTDNRTPIMIRHTGIEVGKR